MSQTTTTTDQFQDLLDQREALRARHTALCEACNEGYNAFRGEPLGAPWRERDRVYTELEALEETIQAELAAELEPMSKGKLPGWDPEAAGKAAAAADRGGGKPNGTDMRRPANWRPGSRWAPGMLRDPNPEQLERSRRAMKASRRLDKVLGPESDEE